MTSPGLFIRNLEDLRRVLFDVLAFRETLKEKERILKDIPENGIINTVYTLLITIQDSEQPFIDAALVTAILTVLKFLPVTETFAHEIAEACNELLDLCSTQSRRIYKSKNPVAYFLMRASHLPGFALLALAAIDLIIRNRRGDRMIPALVAACSTVPAGVQHYNLRPDDIVAPHRYTKKNGNPLSPGTCENYEPIQKSLLEEIKKIYSYIGYGSPTLLLDPEDLEIDREEAFQKRSSFSIKQFPHIAESPVLKPQCIRHLLTYGTYGYDSKIRDFQDFNTLSLMTIPTMIFTYGTRIEDLLSLRLSNFERDHRRLRYDVNPDPLLQEMTIYIPLHDEIFEPIDSLIDYRMSKHHQVTPDERLFVLQSGEGFYPIDIREVKRFFTRLSVRYGKNISETSLYFSHLAYYLDVGGLNPIISDRISNRMESIIYIPRLYCASCLNDIRRKHHSAFRRVSERLGIRATSFAMSVPDECEIVLGGKRAVGKQVIGAVFDYFMSKRPFDFLTSTRWQCFLHNYCMASRVGEITAMSDKSIDLDLHIAKVKVKDTVNRKNSTKVVPLIPFLLEESRRYLGQREVLLRETGQRRFSPLFFRSSGGSLTCLDTSFVNDSYHEISIVQRIEAFTSHCIRYQAESDFTERNFSFLHTNALLSHYSDGDVIFSPDSDASFLDFRRKYQHMMDEILSDYMK